MLSCLPYRIDRKSCNTRNSNLRESWLGRPSRQRQVCRPLLSNNMWERHLIVDANIEDHFPGHSGSLPRSTKAIFGTDSSWQRLSIDAMQLVSNLNLFVQLCFYFVKNAFIICIGLLQYFCLNLQFCHFENWCF